MLEIILNISLVVIGLAAYCFILAKLKHHGDKVRDYIVLPIVIIGGFAVYFIGYVTNPASPDTIASATFRAVQAVIRMMIVVGDFQGINQALRNNGLYMTFFIAVHWMAVLLFIMVIMRLFGRRINSRICLWNQRKKIGYIFFDINNATVSLAKELLRNDKNRLVVFVGERVAKANMSIYDKLEGLGAIYFDIQPNLEMCYDNKRLLALILNRSNHLFFMNENEDLNISNAIRLFEIVRTKQLHDKEVIASKVHIHIRVQSDDIHKIIEDNGCYDQYTVGEAEKTLVKRYFNFSLINDSEVIAMQLIKKFPPVKSIRIDTTKGIALDDYEVMIVGFDRKGGAILRKCIEFGQFVGSKFCATIVDKAVSGKMGSFNTLYPAVAKNYTIDTVESYVGAQRFFDVLKDKANRLKLVVVALGNDELNIHTAMEIDRLLTNIGFGTIPVAAITKDDKNYCYLDASSTFANIHCVGRDRDIFCEDIVVNESMEEVAKRINHQYNEIKKQEFKDKNGSLDGFYTPQWRNLPCIKKMSNISVSHYVDTVLFLLGQSRTSLGGMSEGEYIELLKSNPERFTNLAQTEHLRWCACYFVHGWQRMELSAVANIQNQDHNKHLHACLVDWEELSAVSAHFKEDYQEYDYGNIRYNYTVANLIESNRTRQSHENY